MLRWLLPTHSHFSLPSAGLLEAASVARILAQIQSLDDSTSRDMRGVDVISADAVFLHSTRENVVRQAQVWRLGCGGLRGMRCPRER